MGLATIDPQSQKEHTEPEEIQALNGIQTHDSFNCYAPVIHAASHVDHKESCNGFLFLCIPFIMVLCLATLQVTGAVLKVRHWLKVSWALAHGLSLCSYHILMSQMVFIALAPVVQTLDNAIQRINHYPVDKY